MTNSKLLTLTAVLLTLTAFGQAATITPENPENQTIKPGEEFTQEFNIDLDENDTEVRVTASDTGEYDVGYNSFRIFSSDGTFSADIQAPNDVSNYTYDVQFAFRVEQENGSETVTRSVETFTEIPYDEIQEPVWINQSKQLEFNGQKYNVSEIADNLYLNNNSVRVPYQDYETVNDVRLYLLDRIRGEYAKIRAETRADNDIEFQINQLQINNEEPTDKCVLGVRTITTLQRGKSFAIETINSETDDNEIISGVSVTLINSESGEPIGNTESGASGYASMFIPDDVKGPVIARLAKPSGDCDSTNQRLSFNTPYNNYIENNEEFQLSLKPDNTTVYGDIKGTVSTKDGSEVTTGLIAITRPDGTSTDIAFNETGFSFTPKQSGTYTIQATKQNYVSSSEVDVEYIPDQDGDGVPNDKDRCKSTEGVEANDGCPQIEAEIVAYNTGERAGILRPKRQYTFRIENENGSVIDYTGNASVDGQELSFENGVSRQDNSTTLQFPDQGSYTFTVSSNKFEGGTLEQTYTVESKSPLSGIPALPILATLALLLGGVVLYSIYNSDSSSSSGTSSAGGEFEPDHDFLDGDVDEVTD